MDRFKMLFESVGIIFPRLIYVALEGSVVFLVLWGCVLAVGYIEPNTAVPPLWLLWGLAFCVCVLLHVKKELLEPGNEDMPLSLAFAGHAGMSMIVGLIAAVPVFVFTHPNPSFVPLWAAVSATIFLVLILWGFYRGEHFWFDNE